MKKLLTLFVLFSFAVFTLTSCGKKEEAKQEEKDPYGEYETAEPEKEETAPAESTSSEDLIAQGQALADKSDCKTCHHATNKLVGPPHTDVAKKYEFTRANVTMLADKIINGGSGNWGEIPMAAHADLTKADAEKMAMYVLSLDGEKLKD